MHNVYIHPLKDLGLITESTDVETKCIYKGKVTPQFKAFARNVAKKLRLWGYKERQDTPGFWELLNA